MVRQWAWRNLFTSAGRTTILTVVLCTVFLRISPAFANTGSIRGTILNGSHNQQPMENAQVVLRAQLQRQFLVIEETTTDAAGMFQFDELPVEDGIQYIPGANQGEVHYPSQPVLLTREKQTADVTIVAYESATEPNPLLIHEHEIDVHPTPGALEFTESMIIENPSKFSYVGQANDKPDRVVTFRLSIPQDFEKVTFEKEFFGRRFLLVDGKLLTGIPWPPGKRRLKFTYVIPNDSNKAHWRRTVDLPCSEMRLTVNTDNPANVWCNLDSSRSITGESVTYTTSGSTLPVGHEIELQIGELSTSLMAYGRWTALAILVAIVGGTSFLLSRQEKSPGDNRSR